MRSRTHRALEFVPFGLLPPAIVLVAWEWLGDPSSRAFPVPSTWFGAIRRLYESGALAEALRTTLYTFSLSLVVATVVGTALGAAVATSARVERALTPLMDIVRTLPPPAVVPVAALLLGPTIRASVTIIVFAIVWPILLNTAAAMREIPRVRRDVGRTIGISRLERATKVILPSLAPGVMHGVRIAVSVSLVITLLVDMIGHGSGLGRLMFERQQRFDTQAVWGLMLVIGVLGYVLNAALRALERHLRWCREAAHGN